MPLRYPVLYLQGPQRAHTIVFRIDAFAGTYVVAEHYISGGPPAYLSSFEESKGYFFVTKGRKGLCYNPRGCKMFDTCLLGINELAGRFVADLGHPEADDWAHEVVTVNFDERTGRILAGASRFEVDENPARICLTGLPPWYSGGRGWAYHACHVLQGTAIVQLKLIALLTLAVASVNGAVLYKRSGELCARFLHWPVWF